MNRAAAVASLLAVLAIGCGSNAATATHSSSARLTTPSPIGAPATSSTALFTLLPGQPPANFVSQITCTGSIGASDPVAVVQLHAAVEGTGDIVLRDYANASSPRTACKFVDTHVVQIIDALHVVIGAAHGTYAVVDLPGVQYHWFQLSGAAQFPWLVAVGPNLDQITWLTVDEVGGTDKVHVTTSAGDKVVASLPNPHAGRCGSADDSKQGAYTQSGRYVFVLDQPTSALNSLVVVEGNKTVLSLVPPSRGWQPGAQPAMAVWSPTSETLFFRHGADVWKWTSETSAQRYLTGVSWSYPTITPDGSHLAYAVLRPDGLHSVYLVDLAHNGSPQMIGKGARNRPVFLSPTLLWFKSESQGICGPGGNQPLIYDLADSSESSSVIDQVFAVWPATSSNF